MSCSNLFFKGINALIIPNALGKSKSEFFLRRIEEFGGAAVIFDAKAKYIPGSYSHVVVDQSLCREKFSKITGTEVYDDVKSKIVSGKWVSKCLELKDLVDCDQFVLSGSQNLQHDSIVKAEKEEPVVKIESPPEKRRKNYVSKNQHGESSSYDDLQELYSQNETIPVGNNKLKKDSFICTKSSKVMEDETTTPSPNQHIIKTLQEMVEAYKSTKDKWRAFGYEKAIIALKIAKEPINSYEKALALPGIGKRLAEKIYEISESGGLQKLELLQSNEELQAIQLFMKIWGVGTETANLWASQGLRSLDDVRARAKLTSNQTIGLKYFDDLNERMDRSEVQDIENVVKQAAHALDPGLEVVTCGSYRRGKPTCGDVDILVTHPNGKGHVSIFSKLLNKLHDQGFLTDDLVVQPNMTGGMAKYLGICMLPAPNSKHRRLDIIVTPYNQYGCALIYFTGSAHFNRSMRLMADKMGLSLTEHALYKDVIRQNREIVHHGVIVPTPTELSVFEVLGIPYRQPEERDHS